MAQHTALYHIGITVKQSSSLKLYSALWVDPWVYLTLANKKCLCFQSWNLLWELQFHTYFTLIFSLQYVCIFSTPLWCHTVRIIYSWASGSQCHLTTSQGNNRSRLKSLDMTKTELTQSPCIVCSPCICAHKVNRSCQSLPPFLLLCVRLAPVRTTDLAQTFHAVSQMGITRCPAHAYHLKTQRRAG